MAPPVLPSVQGGALGARPRVTRQRGIVGYTPITPESGGEALSKVGAEVSKKAYDIGLELHKDEQDKRLKQAQIDYSMEKIGILEEFDALNGQDALDGFEGVNKRLREARERHLGSLQGKTAETFDLWSQQDQTTSKLRITQHLNAQRKAVKKVTSTAFIKQMQDEVVANPNNPEAVAEKLRAIRQETLAMADEAGIRDMNARSILVRENWTKAHTQAVERLLTAGMVDEADAYLTEHQAGFDPLLLGAVEMKVAKKRWEKQAQDLAETATSKFATEEEALKWVRSKTSGEAQEAAEDEVEERYREKDRARTRADRDALDAGQSKAQTILSETSTETDALALAAKLRGKQRGHAETAIRQHYATLDREESRKRRDALEAGVRAADYVLDAYPGMSETEAVAVVAGGTVGEVRKQAEARIRQHYAAKARVERENQKVLRAEANAWANSGQLDKMTQDHRDAVNAAGPSAMAQLNKRQEDFLAGRPQTSDKDAVKALYNLLRDDPDKFAVTDLHGDDYLGKLSGTDLRRFENLQLGLDKKNAKEALKTRKVATVMRKAKPLLVDAGFIVGGKKDNTGDFQIALADRLDDLPDDKALTDKETQEIILGMLLQGETANTGVADDDDVRAFEAGAGFYLFDFAKENKATYELFSKRAGINDADRTATILEGLAKRGEPITADRVREVHEKLKAKGK